MSGCWQNQQEGWRMRLRNQAEPGEAGWPSAASHTCSRMLPEEPCTGCLWHCHRVLSAAAINLNRWLCLRAPQLWIQRSGWEPGACFLSTPKQLASREVTAPLTASVMGVEGQDPASHLFWDSPQTGSLLGW